MKRRQTTIFALGLAAVLALPSAAFSQGVGVAVHVGTLGLGADLAVKLNRNVAIRAGGNFVPVDVTIEGDGISYGFDFPTQFTGMIDLYPGGGPLHISGGVLLTDDIGLSAELTGTVDVGGTFYQAADVGMLTAVFTAERTTAPYLGIGIGDPAGGGRFGFLLDLGVAMWGTPTIVLAATGPITALPSFQADLLAEQTALNDDLDRLKVYPVLSIGFTIRLGR